MKNKKILILSIIVNVIFLLIICILISGDKNIIKGKKLVKEMTQSENETNLQTQINTLNASHTDYANSIEESKKKIASAITEMGVETSSDVTLDTMANNIKNISGGTPFMIDLSYEYYGGDSSYRTLSWTAPVDCNVMMGKNGYMCINGVELEKAGYEFEYREPFSDRPYSWISGGYCIFDVKKGDVITMSGSYLIKCIVGFRYA